MATVSRTLALIKPDAWANNSTGKIIDTVLEAGFAIVAAKTVRLTVEQARSFYEVHKERPFYDSLCQFMSSAPLVAMVLQAADAVQQWRTTMGATNPAEAAEGTIRKQFGTDVEHNSCHGSDSDANAALEIGFFFSQAELLALG